MNLVACSSLPTTPENSIWFRAVSLQFLTEALSYDYSKKNISRFNPGALLDINEQFATLYFADDPLPTQFEVGSILGSPKPGYYVAHPNIATATLNVHVVLSEVIDLTDAKTCTALDTNAQELTGDWEGYTTRNFRTSVPTPTGIAPTQHLGMELFKSGVEGFRAISSKVPYHRTLVVFPDNLRSKSILSFTDLSGAFSHSIRPITQQNHRSDPLSSTS